jgi:hypothetical protein
MALKCILACKASMADTVFVSRKKGALTALTRKSIVAYVSIGNLNLKLFCEGFYESSVS